jgi:hypothetical protein
VEDIETDIEHSGEELRWVTHPMMEFPLKAAVFWAVFLLVLLAVRASTKEWVFVVLSGLILIGSLRGFVLPTAYKINAEGIEIDRWFYKTRKKWSDFRSHVVERNGVFLSPFSVKHRMENFRGLFIPTGKYHQQVVEFVGRFVERMK